MLSTLLCLICICIIATQILALPQIVTSKDSVTYHFHENKPEIMTQKWIVQWESAYDASLPAPDTAKSLAMVSIQWENMEGCLFPGSDTQQLPFRISLVASKTSKALPTDEDTWPSLDAYEYISHNITVNKESDVWTSDVGVFLEWDDENKRKVAPADASLLYTKLAVVLDASTMHQRDSACFENLRYTIGGADSVYSPELMDLVPNRLLPNRWYLPVFVVPDDQPQAQRILLSNIHASDDDESETNANIHMYVAVDREPTTEDEVEARVISTRKALTVSPLSPNQRVYIAYRFVPKQNQSIHYSSKVKKSYFKFGMTCPHGCGQDLCNYETGKCICNHAAGRFGPTCEVQSAECTEGGSCQIGKGHGRLECDPDGKQRKCVIEWCETAFFGPNDEGTACQLEMPFFFAFGVIIISSLFSLIVGCICGICGISTRKNIFARLFSSRRNGGLYSSL